VLNGHKFQISAPAAGIHVRSLTNERAMGVYICYVEGYNQEKVTKNVLWGKYPLHRPSHEWNDTEPSAQSDDVERSQNLGNRYRQIN
jgi:hypothetical protein